MDWTARYLVSEAPNGAEYRVSIEAHGDWSAQWAGPFRMLNGMPYGNRDLVTIELRDELGAQDWPSQELAMAACVQHAKLLTEGLSPQQAADRVAADHRAEELAERALADSHAAHVDSDETLGLVRS